ncbi:ABC-F family ATP-binding cassette domain-containing protein [Weeksella virosa]|uniref:ABC-F family ATP-binding cassette domain-containing protein n=1 Tax=Weeksella virosa TaxID=1014 RepID=UPI0025524C51|nr:ABC-F family ATP-binding cassette domain-containing protein [Weeksella virosa]MDK7675335.1 ABC-F family ATP-binding cassette domain-containing protein [Weeksella virosa]
MNYLSVENLTKSYGIRTLFQDVNFHVNQGDQIAFVAKNGSGKSTLLRILVGKDTPDSGEVKVAKDVKILMFEQSDDFQEDLLAEDYIFNHSNEVLDLVHDYERLIQNNPSSPELITLLEKMDLMDAWSVEPKVNEILSKLKIDFLDQKIGQLSGGQRKRISLAKFLIDLSFESGYILLILDEPTNHLDIEMVEWLEYFLNKENKTLILVTHDRYFLDAVCTRILELEDKTIYVHQGNYETYIQNKAHRIENLNANIDKAKNLYRKELEWMRRQPKARTTKSKSRIDSFYDTESIAKQKIVSQELKLEMVMTRLGQKIVEMEKVSKAFGDKKILDNFSYIFARGSKIGLVGKNGVGKTTFIKILEGTEAIDTGSIERGETLKIGHFKQDGIDFDPEQRVIEFIKDIADFFPLANGKQMRAEQFLEMFLFSPEQQHTQIGKLSGGEKKRLQLLAILYPNPNFLILDEPTNDLDLPTLTVLENFLHDFQGSLLVVSHDRYFMDKVVDELMIFEGEGKISRYMGNYTEYFIENRAKLSAQTVEKETKESKPKTEEKIATDKPRKLSYKEQRELEEINASLPFLEEQKEKLANQLSTPDLTYEEITRISNELEKIIQEIDEKEMRWLELN